MSEMAHSGIEWLLAWTRSFEPELGRCLEEAYAIALEMVAEMDGEALIPA